MKILFATRNLHKLSEVSEALCCELPVEKLYSLKDFPDAPAFEEMGDSFQEIAKAKALFYSDWLVKIGEGSFYVLAEDAGLEVALLNGFPGIVSNRIGRTDEERILIVLEKLSEAQKDDVLAVLDDSLPSSARIAPGVSHPSRSARFVSAMALAKDGELLHLVEGVVHGLIAFEPRGSNGFGYDPIFYYPPLKKTFGECAREEKAKVSHRANALRKVIAFLREEQLRDKS
jgi:XTP/dITP diphosphohydrolase